MNEDFEKLLGDLGLTLRAVLPSEGSRFVARVWDGQHELAFKVVGERGTAEVLVLRVWSAAGLGPRWFRQVRDDAYTCEWIQGQTLSGRSNSDILQQIGRLLRSMHEAPIPEGLQSPSARVSAQAIRNTWKRLKSSWLNQATVVGQAIQDELAGAQALLHGDLVPSNIILTGRGPVAIDPVGYRGPAAWDLAQLAVALVGTERRANLAHLVRGYGTRPPLLDECFEWMAFMFLEKNLALESEQPGSRRQFVEELSALVDTF
jgi:tRNA A-37 threonylcarbamoyl transferase component Bud32